MLVSEIISLLESVAPLSLQEPYDNAGLLTGSPSQECTGILCCLDTTEEVVMEAIDNGCNCIVAHHPIIFKSLKSITGRNYVERAVIRAIKNDIAIYAIHTNLDNILAGVNQRIAAKLALQNTRILEPGRSALQKIYTFVPIDYVEKLKQAVFEAGAGHIGKYSECSFGGEGTGTFKAGPGTDPFVGRPGERHEEREVKLEFLCPGNLISPVIRAMLQAHPYEEVAYDVIKLENPHPEIGAGLIGELPEAISSGELLGRLQHQFALQVIRHTRPVKEPVSRIAVCGGAGSFLISKALSSGADVFITADIKYHEFFDADGRMMICDIGHFESEQFTIGLLYDLLVEKFPTFAILKTRVRTNPVHYYTGRL